MPKRLLLIAATTGYQTRAFTAAAESLGYELALATDRCHVLEDPWGDHAFPLRFEDPAGSAEALATADFQVDGIVALGDVPAYIAALAAQRMGMIYSPPEAVARSRNKFHAHERFRDAGLLTPEFERISLDAGPDRAAGQARYPCVLKPLGLSASRGVIRADTPAEFVAAFRRIEKIVAGNDRFLQVETFIEGREFALEGILSDGRLRVLAIFDKPDPLDGPFFEETIYVTPSREDPITQHAIAQTTQVAIDALGLTRGPIHAEMRVNQRGVWMLEVASRPIGGLCARVLPGLEELILRHAAFEEDPGDLAMPSAASGVMMIPIPREGIYVDVEGLEAARSEPGIEDIIISAKQGQKLIPLPEGASYLGFIFARGDTPGAVERALRAAHRQLDFEIATTLPVV